jgi:hypothetical protein
LLSAKTLAKTHRSEYPILSPKSRFSGVEDTLDEKQQRLKSIYNDNLPGIKQEGKIFKSKGNIKEFIKNATARS